MNQEQVTIIGAGPSGLATALQLKRYGIEPFVIEKERIGGLLHNANLVENYPGFPGGIPGPQLVDLFTRQVLSHDLRLLLAHLEKLEYRNGQFEFTLAGQTYHSSLAVIASGTKPRLLRDLHIPDEIQESVYYEVYPLLGVKEKQITIVGAGDAAFDYGLNLAQHNDITILNRGYRISCLPLLWERARVNSRIDYHQQTRITRLSAGSGGKIAIECDSPQGSKSFTSEYLIVAIGREPNLDFISGQFAEKAIQLENSGKLYYVGDVVNGLYRQTAIAVGDGIFAAMKIYKYLKENV